MTRVLDWMDRETSTRSMGLLRVLLPLIAWSEYAGDMLPYHDLRVDRLLLSLAFFVSTTWMLLGWFGRLGTAAAGAVQLVMVYVYGRHLGVEPWTHHHTTILANATAMLALTPCSTSLSVDRWLAVRAAERAGVAPPPERGPAWALPLIALQVSAAYLWSAWDKTTVPFLTGVRLEQIFVEKYLASDVVLPRWARPVFASGAVAVVIVEYVLPFGLFVPALQRWLVPLGLLMHAVFYVSIPVGTFTVTMAALYLAYIDPDDLHRWTDRWLGRSPDVPLEGAGGPDLRRA